MNIAKTDRQIITVARKLFLPAARFSIFVVYCWFGLMKLFDLSAAEPLARTLAAKTIGIEHFDLAFNLLAVYECVIGVLFLFPKATRVVIPLLLVHMVIVCSPLFLVPHLTWYKFLLPTLEGQYIIKNLAIIALAIGIAAQTTPVKAKKYP